MQEDYMTERTEVTLTAEELYEAACRWGIDRVLHRLGLATKGCEPLSARQPAWISELPATSFRGCWMRYHQEKVAGEEFIHCVKGQVIHGQRLRAASSSFMLRREQRWEPLCCAWMGQACHSTRIDEHRADWPAMLLSRQAYDALITRLQELELNELIHELAIHSGDYEASIALARSLKQPGSCGEILFYGKHTSHQQLELHQIRFVSTEAMNWLLRESAGELEDWLIASPTSRRQFQEMLESWLMDCSGGEI